MDDVGELFSFVLPYVRRPGSLNWFAFQILAALTVPSVLLRRSGRPTAAVAWLLGLSTVPPLAVISWWAFGRTRMDRRLRSQVNRRRGFVPPRSARPSNEARSKFEGWLPDRALENHASTSTDNEVLLLRDGRQAFARMEEAILGAKHSVHLLFYSFELDKTGLHVLELLANKAREGLAVRVLVDGFGSSRSITALRTRLTEAGASFAVFLPSRLSPITAPRLNFINHRKIVVVDERIAICGGMNIGDEYRRTWHDIMLQISGSAVRGLSRILLEDWYFATRELVDDPSPLAPEKYTQGTDVAVVASGPDTEPWIHDAYFTAINRARHRLFIATPYFIPTPSILTALRTACGRGVDVRILLPSRSDVGFVQWASRSYYPSLVYAGVRIFEFGNTMVHAKALLIDDDIISVGTANVDNRSFRLNFEVCCFVSDPRLANELLGWMNEHWPLAREITPAYLADKGTLRRLIESAAHLMSPLL